VFGISCFLVPFYCLTFLFFSSLRFAGYLWVFALKAQNLPQKKNSFTFFSSLFSFAEYADNIQNYIYAEYNAGKYSANKFDK
jgi:hypothetical protein